MPQVRDYTRFSPFFNPDACKAIFTGICVFRACLYCMRLRLRCEPSFNPSQRRGHRDASPLGRVKRRKLDPRGLELRGHHSAPRHGYLVLISNQGPVSIFWRLDTVWREWTSAQCCHDSSISSARSVSPAPLTAPRIVRRRGAIRAAMWSISPTSRNIPGTRIPSR